MDILQIWNYFSLTLLTYYSNFEMSYIKINISNALFYLHTQNKRSTSVYIIFWGSLERRVKEINYRIDEIHCIFSLTLGTYFNGI